MLNSFDQISIILGIILGTVIAVLFIKYGPVLLRNIKQVSTVQKVQKKDSSSFDGLLRKHMLKKVQAQHLAQEICSLNDIYVQQYLYSHPLHANVAKLPDEEPIFLREALSVLDVPELACELPLPKLTLSQALSGGCNIAIAGAIGTGKTACLANFVSEILEKRCAQSVFNDYLPIYFHIAHLSLYSKLPLFECLSRCLYDEGLDISPPELEKELSDYVIHTPLLLVIDGMDEFRQTDFNNAVTMLQRLHKENPQVLMVTTCGPYYSGRLDAAGFTTLPIIPAGQVEYKKALMAWLKVWQRINPSLSADQPGSHEAELITLWINQENLHPTYADFTFMVLSVLFRDFVPENRSVLPYLRRKTNGKVHPDTLVHLANFLARDCNFIANLNDVQKSLSTIPGSQTGNPSETLDRLLSSGVVNRYADQLRFTNPSIVAHLLVHSETYTPVQDANVLIHSPIDDLVTRFTAVEADYIVKWLETLNPFDARSLSLTVSHLFSKSVASTSFNAIIPKLAKYLVSEQLPLSSKIKFAAIINYANPSLFSQLLTKLETLSGKDCKRVCAFFYSFLPLKPHEAFLVDTLEHSDPRVSIFGFLSLLISSDPRAANLLLEVIQSDAERYGRFISELCSQYPNSGHQLIRHLSQQENATLRRFSVYGLRLIPDVWATELLDEISRTDKAWIIRDAAAQALNSQFNPIAYAPQPLPRIVDNPLIVSSVVKKGIGIPANGYPYELLFDLLENGVYSESLTALQYLITRPNAETLAKIKRLIALDKPIRELAARALFEISLRE